MSESPSRRGNTVLVMAVIVAIVLIPFGYSVVSSLFAHESPPLLEKPDPQHTSCVRETEYMRYHHWELLRRVREEVVRYGRRGDVGLKKCWECHTSRSRFCDQCHHAVSLYPDCFDCHHSPP